MKNLSWIPFVLIACIAIGAVTPKTVSAQGTTVSVQPEHIEGPPPTIGETFEINITVSNVANLYTWQAGMTFNPNLLEALSFEEGPFLKTWAETNNQTTIWMEGTIDNLAGVITYYGCGLTGPISGASGDGILGTITFKVKNYGNSTLNLTDVTLLNPALSEISIDVANGYFELPAIPHDVAVINVVPSTTTVYAGQSIDITVVVMNRGTAIETFNVTAYNDTTTIETQVVINLNPGEIRNLTFVWDTTAVAPCTNHTISAEATAVPGEVNVTDNIFVFDGTIGIKMVGDANGDGKVNYEDLFILAASYGSYPGHDRWNPDCDFNNDDIVNWKDLFQLAASYGKTCP